MDFMTNFFAGGVGVAIVTGFFKLLENWQNQKSGDGKEKRRRYEEQIDANAASIGALRSAMRVVLHDRIKHLARAYVEKGEIGYDDREDLVEMHSIYHELGGNGNLDALMRDFMAAKVR